MRKIIGIYKITSPIGKVYIGQSHDINNRFKYYFSMRCSGQKHLYNSLKEYGIGSHKFEIIEECEPELLNELEIKHISFYNSTNREIGLNLQSGGKHCNDSEESRLLKKLNHPHRKIFYAEKDGIVMKFLSMNDAEKILHITRKSIRESLSNNNKRIGGYSYSYQYPTILVEKQKRTRAQTQQTRELISKNSSNKRPIIVTYNDKELSFDSIVNASKYTGDTKKVIHFALKNPERSKSEFKYKYIAG